MVCQGSSRTNQRYNACGYIMDNIINLIARTINEAEGPDDLPEVDLDYEQSEGSEEYTKNERDYENAKRKLWQLFDNELSILERYARRGKYHLEKQNLTASELPNFSRLNQLCRDKIWVDLKYPRILDSATRQSPRKMVLFGHGRLDLASAGRLEHSKQKKRLKLPTADKTDHLQIYTTGNLNLESLVLHYADKTREKIAVNQLIPKGSSEVIRINSKGMILRNIDFLYKLPDEEPVGVQVYGLVGASDEDAMVYIRRLFGNNDIRRYRTGPNGDKLLLPGKWDGLNTITRTGVGGQSIMDPEHAGSEADLFMNRLLKLKLDVIQPKADGSKLRDWIKHKFDRRFPEFSSYKENKRLIKARQARWVLNAKQLRDYNPEDGLTLEDIRDNVKDWIVLIKSSIESIRLPKITKKLEQEENLEDLDQVFNFKVSGEDGKKEYCHEIIDILEDHNQNRLSKINSIFRVIDLIKFLPEGDNLKDIGQMVANHYEKYSDQLLERLEEFEYDKESKWMAGGAKIGGREIPRLLSTKYYVYIGDDGMVEEVDFDSQEDDLSHRLGPAGSAKRVRTWNSLVERGNKDQRCVLKYDVAGKTFYVGTTLGEVYSRGFIETGLPSKISEFATKLENVKILPAQGHEDKIVSSAKYLQNNTNKYSAILNMTPQKWWKELLDKHDVVLSKASLDDLEGIINEISEELGLSLDVSILSNHPGRGDRIAWKSIKHITEYYINNYGSKNTKGWRPGFFMEGGFKLKHNPKGRKKTLLTPEALDVPGTAYHWGKMVDGARDPIIASHPVFYQSWLPTETEIEHTISVIEEKLDSPVLGKTVKTPKGDRTPPTRKKLEQQLFELQEALKELGQLGFLSPPNVSVESLDDIQLYEWPEYTNPDQEITVEYRGANCVCNHPQSKHQEVKFVDDDDEEENTKCRQCDCEEFTPGREQSFTEVMTVKDYYEKDMENQYDASIPDSSDYKDEEDYIVRESFQAYTNPIYDKTKASGTTICKYCSEYDGDNVYHLKFSKLGDTDYKKAKSWDSSVESKGYHPGQLVRLSYEVYRDGKTTSRDCILRRHEISERMLLEKFEPRPTIHPAVDPKIYRDLYKAKQSIKKLGGVGNEELAAEISNLETEIKNSKQQVFVLIPEREISDGRKLPASVEIVSAIPEEEGGRSKLEMYLNAVSSANRDDRIGILSSNNEWRLKILAPKNTSMSVDNNGLMINRDGEYSDPKRPGGSDDDSNIKPYKKNLQQKVFRALTKAVSTGKMDEYSGTLSDPLRGGLAPWIAHERIKDVYYLIMPPVNQKFIDTLNTDQRGEYFPGETCYHCDRKTGFLPIYRATDNSYHVDVPYVRLSAQGEPELTPFDLPLTEALKHLKELWISHRWTHKELHFPDVGIYNIELDDSNIDGFKTYRTHEREKETSVAKILGLIEQRMGEEKYVGKSKCQNKIIDKSTGQRKLCEQPAFINETPKVLVRTDKGGWRLEHPAVAKAYQKWKEASQDETSREYLSAENELIEARFLSRNNPEHLKKFCQSCFISRFNVFPEHIIKEMSSDLENVLAIARTAWVKGDDIVDPGERNAVRREISGQLENFAIKWFSTKSFWKAWEDYISKDIGLKGATRKGTSLPDYLTKNLLRARYAVMKHLEDIARDINVGYLRNIFETNKATGKPDYISKLERIQGVINGWGVWNNNFKLRGYDRSEFQRGDTGLIHTVSLWRVMTKKEREASPYAAAEKPMPWFIEQTRAAKGAAQTRGEIVNDSISRNRDLVIIDGVVGADSFLNGLAGYVESVEPNGTLIVELKKNNVVVENRVKLFEGEYIYLYKSHKITISEAKPKSQPVVPQASFEDKYKSLIVKESKKRSEKSDIIRLIGDFTSDSLYW